MPLKPGLVYIMTDCVKLNVITKHNVITNQQVVIYKYLNHVCSLFNIVGLIIHTTRLMQFRKKMCSNEYID